MINSVLYLSRFIGVVEYIGFHRIKTAESPTTEQSSRLQKYQQSGKTSFFPLNKLSHKSVYALLDKMLCTTCVIPSPNPRANWHENSFVLAED